MVQWSAETGEYLGDSRIEMGRGWHHLANGAVVCLCLAGMMEIGEGGSHLGNLCCFSMSRGKVGRSLEYKRNIRNIVFEGR